MIYLKAINLFAALVCLFAFYYTYGNIPVQEVPDYDDDSGSWDCFSSERKKYKYNRLLCKALAIITAALVTIFYLIQFGGLLS